MKTYIWSTLKLLGGTVERIMFKRKEEQFNGSSDLLELERSVEEINESAKQLLF